ncbi:MAG: type II toxin-antitoxin system VapC family toxin [Planctomycetes bacterium]|nr:type II toxin-antitoxin system VapC family toxin [Planctomycetota bacterium]
MDMLQVHAPGDIAITIVTLEEQMRGRLAALNRRGADLTAAYSQLHATADYFCGLTILPFDAEAMKRYQRLRSQKIRVGALDLRIASIALEYNATLITRNRRDFERVPGLRFEDWSQ